MATVTRTIGAAGNYPTITLWEADLDNGAIYNSGDDAVGNIVDNANFDEDVVINGGGTVGLNSIRLTVDSTVRHNGTEGSGARIVRSANVAASIVLSNSAVDPVTIEWLEIDSNQQGQRFGVRMQGGQVILRNCLIHGLKHEAANDSALVTKESTDHCHILRCVIYDLARDDTARTCAGILDNNGTLRELTVNNCTIDNISGGANAYGIRCDTDNTNRHLRNNVVTRTDSGDFSNASAADASNNASEDSSAPGTSPQTLITPSNEFESLTAGSEDYHLKSTSTIIDDGTDLGVTNGVNIDIDGRDVDALLDTWDIGADEFVSGGISIPPYRPRVQYY